VSLARLLDHRQVATGFDRLAPEEPQPDVIVAAYPTIELCAASARYAIPRDIPLAMDIRDLWPDIFSDAMPSILRPLAHMALTPYQRIARRTLASANALFSITDPILEWGLAKAGRERRPTDRVIPFAYESNMDLAGQDAAFHYWKSMGLDFETQFVICFLGTFGQILDFDTVIRAARLLVNQGVRDVRFVLCGLGDTLDPFREQAKDLPSVVFPGWVDAAKIAALMANSKLGLVPYRPRLDFSRSIPNKAAEYLSAGLPILTCLDGLLSRTVEQYSLGYTYVTGNPDSLASRILEAKTNRENLNSRKETCLSFFNREFRADIVFGKYQAAIESLVAWKTPCPRSAP
jgi:glycosyltransferase involved in cell wall biosynthesis